MFAPPVRVKSVPTWWWNSPLSTTSVPGSNIAPPQPSPTFKLFTCWKIPRLRRGIKVPMEKADSHDRRRPSKDSTSKRKNSEIFCERDSKERPPSTSAGKSNKRGPQETQSSSHQSSSRPKKQKVYAQPAPIERPSLLDEPSLVSLLSPGQCRMFPLLFLLRCRTLSHSF